MQEGAKLGEERNFKFSYYDRGSYWANFKEGMGIESWWEAFIPTRSQQRDYSKLIVPSIKAC